MVWGLNFTEYLCVPLVDFKLLLGCKATYSNRNYINWKSSCPYTACTIQSFCFILIIIFDCVKSPCISISSNRRSAILKFPIFVHDIVTFWSFIIEEKLVCNMLLELMVGSYVSYSREYILKQSCAIRSLMKSKY